MNNKTLSRRTLLTTAAGIGLAGALASCSRGGGGSTTGGGGGDGGTSGGGASGAETIRFTFWGSDFRFEYTDAIVQAFMEANDDVTVEQEPGEWSGYFDRLATQTAAGDEPDVINMDGKFLAEYAGRGVLADLEQLDIDLSSMATSDLDSGRLDGTLYAISTGQNAWVIMANPAVFEAAGVDMPDDKTWTWDDLMEIATAVSDSGTDHIGISGGGSYADMTIWARQQGEDLWGPDGMAMSQDVFASWMQFYLDLQTSGATLSASGTEEENALSLEQQAFGTGKAAMTWAWTNTYGSICDAVGSEDIVMLRPPSVTGVVTENGLYGKASMFWSISARTEAPESSAKLVDFLINDPTANTLQMLDRGVPSNPEVVERLQADLSDVDRYVVDFMTEVLAEISTAPAVQPMGASTAPDVFTRYLSEVRFESMTPADAAAAAIDEVNGLIASA